MAQLREGEALRAQISGPQEQVKILLDGIIGVLEVRVEPSANGEGVYTVISSIGLDLRDELARQVVNRGFGLRELRPLDMSLEDIYLRLTTEEASVRDA